MLASTRCVSSRRSGFFWWGPDEGLSGTCEMVGRCLVGFWSYVAQELKANYGKALVESRSDVWQAKRKNAGSVLTGLLRIVRFFPLCERCVLLCIKLVGDANMCEMCRILVPQFCFAS